MGVADGLLPIAEFGLRPVLEKINLLIRRTQRPQCQGSRAARYQINSGQPADAANTTPPSPGKVTSILWHPKGVIRTRHKILFPPIPSAPTQLDRFSKRLTS